MRACVLAALLLGLSGCAYDFDSICVEGEICDPDSLALPPTSEPMVGQVAACSILLGTCSGTSSPTACHFVISGESVDATPQCTAAAGSATRDRPCSDMMGCGLGLTCVRPAVGAPGVCRDLCTTLADCASSSSSGTGLTCDRSRRVATLGGVPVYACAPVDTSSR